MNCKDIHALPLGSLSLAVEYINASINYDVINHKRVIRIYIGQAYSITKISTECFFYIFKLKPFNILLLASSDQVFFCNLSTGKHKSMPPFL